MVEPLPPHLRRALSLPSRTDYAGAADARSACGEVAARIVILEEALRALLAGDIGAEEKARRALAIGWS